MLLKWRLIPNNQTIVDFLDFFENDGFTRISGISPLQAQVFVNGVPQSWTTIDGTSVGDAQVVAGYVYWSEATTGFYSVRWRPSSVGFWRLSFTYSTVPQIVTLDYDVVTSNPSQGGLNVSLVG